MTLLHFQPIQGKALDIIEAILKAEEVVPVADGWSLLSVVVEEIVLNIVDYSHSDYIDVEIIRDEESITLRFHDSGVPYNPLDREFPDFSTPMEDRKIGGLGIFMVIQYMDDVAYEHTAGENIFMNLLGIIGGQEILIILVIVLVLFGGRKIPELMRGLGKGVKEYKNAVNGVEDEVRQATEEKPEESKDSK